AWVLRLRSSRMIKPHDTISHERVDVGGTESKLNENFLRLCAEPLWRKPGLRCLAVVTYRMVDERNRCSGFAAAGHRDQGLRMRNLRIGDEGRIVLNRRVPDLGALEQGQPGLGSFLLECGRDQFANLILLRPGVAFRERGKPRLADRLAQRRQRTKRNGEK